jgi:hypothetical protein
VPLFKRNKPVEAAPEPEPEEVPAQDYVLKLAYGAKSSDGVRMAVGLDPFEALRALVTGFALGDVEIVEPRPVEFAQAAPDLERPSEALQWVSAHAELGPVARHAVMILELVDALDPSVDTLACGLLAGDIATTGYPLFDAVVGGVAAHWDEATGDLIVRGVVGWGGRGVRGDTERAASRLVNGLTNSLRMAAGAGPITTEDRPMPASAGVGLVCPSCGYSSSAERAFYCPKCGMRLLRA